jgi:hypothetical protein
MKQVGAVADLTLLSAGSTRFWGACWLDEELDDELLELEELDEEDDELEDDELEPCPGGVTHAGTTSVSMPVLAGSTSCWSWLPDCCCCCWPCGEPPPGVISTVLTGGPCGCGPLDELLELDDELDDDEPLCDGWHGCTATVWVSVPRGTTIVFEPGGIFALPVWTSRGAVTFGGSSPGRGHGGMTIVMSFFCLPISTVRVPGVWSAIETPSDIELDDELLLPPHAATPSARAAAAATPAEIRLPVMSPPYRIDRPGKRSGGETARAGSLRAACLRHSS